MLNNVCVTCNAVGFVSLVHPSQPLEEENNFEILGAWGPWFEYFVNLLYHTSIINPPSLSFARMTRVIPEILSIWGIGYCIPPQKFPALRQCCCRCAENRNLRAATWGTPTMVSQRRTHSWAELSWPHKRAKMPNRNLSLKNKKQNAPETSPEQRHPLVSLSYFQNFELFFPFYIRSFTHVSSFGDLSVHEEKV